MQILRDTASIASLNDPELRQLIEQRIQEINEHEPWDPETLGYFIVAEVGDSIEALETESGCPILGNLFDDSRFPDDEFSPCFEWLEEHDGCYEAVWILNDGGFGITLLVPKQLGMNPDLLAMCATYATPSSPGAGKADIPASD